MILSRRRVLAALAAAGGAGALAGTGTAAVFRDSERSRASITAGTVDLVVEYELLTGPGTGGPGSSGTVDGPRITLPVDSLAPNDDAGSMLLTFALPQRGDAINNPAALWLATDCPVPEATGLGEAIRVTLSYADCESGTPLSRIVSGSLREVADDLRDGRRVDSDPTTTEPDCLVEEVCLLVEYELAGYVGTETVDFPLWFAAVQCRHATPTNPFAGIDADPCPPGDPCTCCRTLGKLELDSGTQPGIDDSYVEPGTYVFTDGDTDYGLEIYDTADKDAGTETVGVAFRLVHLVGDAVPSLCTVAIKNGPGFEQYDRDDDTLADTAGLPGSDADGLVYAPDGSAISHVTVCVCTTEPEADCPGCTDPSFTNSGSGGPSGDDDADRDEREPSGDADGSTGRLGGRGGTEPDGSDDPAGRSGPSAAPPGGDR
ncbi:SipW-dependent-type signal peptide-containing protein [Haloplanus salilacus]|uniref:SipW-dependent-type signal peptide-containing protein n=1 Tax=Haloplanus salilacus TaxID=2949994 RepID=UPI0030CB325D